MKKNTISAALLSLLLQSNLYAQKSDSLFNKYNLRSTEINVVYSHYAQNGSNSAVTGGIGTEKLTVYAPSFQIKNSFKNHFWQLNAGADIISSASTDNIDHVVSSASILDMRSHVDLKYGLKPKKSVSQYTLGSGFSIESDYFSIPFYAAFNTKSANKMRTFNADFKASFDDLRWGRLNSDYYKPVKLIYPEELRNTAWFNQMKRQSYTLKTSLSNILNKSSILGVMMSFTKQDGLLSTPFHRVYFKNLSLKVENLPLHRYKLSSGIKLNRYLGKGVFLRSLLDYYQDDWGIKALAVENELAIKIGLNNVITPFFRLYSQTPSRYFAPYAQHLISETFYTSDYDLSRLKSIKLGVEYKNKPQFVAFKNTSFKAFSLRYAFYLQNNGLFAHIVSVDFKFENTKKISLKP